MSSRFELRRGLLDIINVEFEPGVRDGNVAGPGSMTAPLAAVARARSFLRLSGLQYFVAAALFFEGNAEGLAVQLATCRNDPERSDRSRR